MSVQDLFGATANGGGNAQENAKASSAIANGKLHKKPKNNIASSPGELNRIREEDISLLEQNVAGLTRAGAIEALRTHKNSETALRVLQAERGAGAADTQPQPSIAVKSRHWA